MTVARSLKMGPKKLEGGEEGGEGGRGGGLV
jgi:hypothetical protein